MDHGPGRALHGLKGLADDMVAALGQHLHGHILGDHVVLDQSAQKGVLRLAGGGEAHLDLLEADLHQHFEELQLFLEIHGHDQALVAVAQIDAAPNGGLFNVIFLHPAVFVLGGIVITYGVLACVHHGGGPPVKSFSLCIDWRAGSQLPAEEAIQKALATQEKTPLRDEGLKLNSWAPAVPLSLPENIRPLSMIGIAANHAPDNGGGPARPTFVQLCCSRASIQWLRHCLAPTGSSLKRDEPLLFPCLRSSNINVV